MAFVWFGLLLVLFGLSVVAILTTSRGQRQKSCPVCTQALRATAKACSRCDSDVSAVIPEAEEGSSSQVATNWGLFGSGLFVLAVMAVLNL